MSYSEHPSTPSQLPVPVSPPYGNAPAYAPPAAGNYYPYPAVMNQPPIQTVQVVALKTPGIAVLLTFLWMGAGHLYANRIGTGIVLMGVDAVLVALSLTGVGLFLTVPIWVVMMPIVMVLASSATTQYNAKLSQPRY